MPIEVKFEKLPDDNGMSGPPMCPPDRIALWLKGKLEAAGKEAEESGGQVVGFLIDKADVEIPDETHGRVVASKDHLFIAISYPEE